MKSILHSRLVVVTIMLGVLLTLSIPQFAQAKTSQQHRAKDTVNCFASADTPVQTAQGIGVTGNIQCFGGSANRIDIQVSLQEGNQLLNAASNGGLNTNFAAANTSSSTGCGQSVQRSYSGVVSGSWSDDNGFHTVTIVQGPPAFLTC